MAKAKPQKLNSALRFIMLLLVVSGLIRLGSVGTAVALNEAENDLGTLVAPTSAPADTSLSDEEFAELLKVVKARTAELDEKERALDLREQNIAQAEAMIEQNLQQLVAAEEELSATLAQVDGASEGDLDRLTSVYESMKPKDAAALFEQMTPEFAAGFLGRMAPPAAAGILSGLSSDAGYAISVVLAGRNALVPKQ